VLCKRGAFGNNEGKIGLRKGENMTKQEKGHAVIFHPFVNSNESNANAIDNPHVTDTIHNTTALRKSRSTEVSTIRVETVLNAPENPNENAAASVAIAGVSPTTTTIGEWDCPAARHISTLRLEQSTPIKLATNVPRKENALQSSIRKQAPSGANSRAAAMTLELESPSHTATAPTAHTNKIKLHSSDQSRFKELTNTTVSSSPSDEPQQDASFCPPKKQA
jgi:hypothetical protein